MAKTFFGAVTQQLQSSGTTLTLLRHELGRPLPHHTHEAAYFLLLVGGAYREIAGAHELEYRQCSLVYHPPHFEHRDEIAPGGATFFVMQLERAMSSRSFGEYPLLAPEMLGLYRKFRAGIASTLDIDETTARLAHSAPHVPETSTPPWLHRVIAQLHDAPENEWTLDELALLANVHPAHLSRVFRQRLGLKIGDYVQRLRIDRAARMLSKKARIADVAHACGFADHAHFTRVCRAVTGATPTELRDAIV